MMLGALSAAVITIGVETLLLGLLYRRDTLFLGLCASLNLATNLVLNLVLWLIPLTVRWWLVYPLELLIVAVEYAVNARACGRSGRLFLLTLAANVLSYCTGILIYGHV